ncbi:hypothetical protein CI109_106474 [Kwoniella shandongensis]|uniref:Uncharacterized protein n=1 Tax=Kwoniella shandongensis TaxID=1734106 RepID=A0A5M6C6V1_9TREE|nr:uncharacterized protein CI109_002656 [Kwoniella shandongensis]KAA5528899.1 hypothetical protein CI109_002656 [Kwoniella shandongensis]
MASDQTPSPDAVLHLAALHTLAATGFASTSQAASMTLSSVMAKYLRLVATACVERASLAGRSKVAAVDVVDALDELGVQVGELYDWAVEEGQVSFEKDGLGGLEDYLEDGLAVEEGIAELKLVPEGELEQDAEDASADEDEPMDEDVEVKSENQERPELEPEPKPFIYRPASPDLSWLPPLPNSDRTIPNESSLPLSPTAATTTTSSAAAPAPQSIAERYRRPISHASSQLLQSHPFVDPPRPTTTTPLPPAPSSLTTLISTYHAIAQDPSVTLRQDAWKRQATELLRNSIATVDSFSPRDTLVTPIPPVRATPIVPSHSDILPQKLLPVNPKPTGLLSSLLHQIQSPHLPPPLRERLTSLRPPMPQVRDNNPILFGEPVRGPDDAALLKAKGKHVDLEGAEGTPAQAYAYLQQTWDSGPRGVEKFSKGRLPTGKKVIMSKEGEAVPRISEERKKEREEAQKVKLRLPSVGGLTPGGGGLTTPGGAGASGGGGGFGEAVSPGSGFGTGGMVMKIKLAAPRKDAPQAVSPTSTVDIPSTEGQVPPPREGDQRQVTTNGDENNGIGGQRGQ